MFDPERDEVAGEMIKLHERLHNLYFYLLLSG
jgi:hypothetical protein